MPPRVAVLVSGSGRSLRNLLELERAGRLPVHIALVISSRDGVAALDHAAAFGVKTLVLRPGAVTEALDDAGIDLVVMAGYLRRWPLPARYIGRTINIHPALLPLYGGKGFYGDRVHEAVLHSGMRVSGCTVHFVTADYDAGAIIAQEVVPVEPGDDVRTLAARVFAKELDLLPRVVADLAAGRVRLEAGRAVGPAIDGRAD